MGGRPALHALALLCVVSACAPDESSVGSVFRAEPGLAAAYFDGRSFQRPSGAYQDPSIDFETWQLNQLVQSRGHVAHTLSIVWTGQIWLPHVETTTVSFELRGRVRVWIGETLIVDDWVDGGSLREPHGTVTPPSAGWQDLRVEWDQLDGPMDARLRYQSASQSRAVVPPSALRHLEP